MRAYDVVLFGATGFTGGLTAEYLARHAPADLRWALAGRNRGKLEAVRARLAEIDDRFAALDLLVADSGDAASLRAVAEATKVVITTVGPYLTQGEPLVAACAEAGTDYVDLTGEPEFVDRMYLAHDRRARETGARLVHACGFDSIPHDLGAWFTVRQLPEGVPLRVDGYVRASGMPSGGTFLSALTIMGRLAAGARVGSRARGGRAAAGRAVRARPARAGRTGSPATGWWAVPLPTIDPEVVRRSAAASERYGPDFTYRHFAAVKHLPILAGGVAGAGALLAAAQIPPARRGAVQAAGARQRPEPRAPGPLVVLGAVHRRRRRLARGDGGVRRRPGLRRNGEDARGVGAVPGDRRPAGNGGPGDHGDGDGRRADRPAHQGGPALRDTLTRSLVAVPQVRELPH